MLWIFNLKIAITMLPRHNWDLSSKASGNIVDNKIIKKKRKLGNEIDTPFGWNETRETVKLVSVLGY